MTNDPATTGGTEPTLRFPVGTSAEEVAVVTALLTAAGGPEPAAVVPPRTWGAPRRAVRRATAPARNGWWQSQLP